MRYKGRIVLGLVAAVVIGDLAWGPHARLGPGQRLPAFSEYAGQVVLLEFFASW